MRSPLDLLVRLRYLLLFLVLETVSLVILFRFNSEQGSVATTAASSVAGGVRGVTSSIGRYFSLSKENRALAEENAMLRDQLYALRDSSELALLPSGDSHTVVARVIDNTIRKDNNLITLDRGSRSGLKAGMGVYDSNGVVGVVFSTSSNYSLVLPLVNTKSSVSCRVKGLDCFGFVEWKGGDVHHVNLKDLPSHSGVAKGDTVLTSGFSAVFPKDIIIGMVDYVEADAGTPEVSVTLAVDFSTLSYVYVSTDMISDELINLKREAGK